MISSNQVKFIKSLEHKKYRKIHQSFVVEGEKMVLELLNSPFEVTQIFATKPFLNHYSGNLTKGTNLVEVTDQELKKISTQQTPNQVLAIAKLPQEGPLNLSDGNLFLALDNVQDPGNLGTIIRTAAWFGIRRLFCSPDTVDAFNPKVIQSTMGSIFRVHLHYSELIPILEQAHRAGFTTLGTLLTGTDMYEHPLPPKAIIVMGNESKGISPDIQRILDQKIKIPSFPENAQEVESLNVAVATALVCAEFRRQNVKLP
ncbi:MAG: RNA methyltransferase [Salinivirgaceae bacterium]|nr:RNA methyltransferase [Salinivirgaceae bacterium]